MGFELFAVEEREDGLLQGSAVRLSWHGLGGDVYAWLLGPLSPPHLRRSADYQVLDCKWTGSEESVVLRVSPPALAHLRAWRQERAAEAVARARDRRLIRLYLHPRVRGPSFRRALKDLVRRLVADLRCGRLLFVDVG